ncbi:MAG: hypothetical protein Q4C68_08165 [Moraxella sp.]|nr:hypothetical protein [Moraxella sp.]
MLCASADMPACLLNTYPSISKTLIQNEAIGAIVVMMGGNETPAQILPKALALLNEWTSVRNVTALACHISQDHTGRSVHTYHNQAVLLEFTTPFLWAQITAHLKSIERLCGRDDTKNSAEFGYLVALDLDILAVQTHRWYVIAERLPFKAHEKLCLGLTA